VPSGQSVARAVPFQVPIAAAAPWPQFHLDATHQGWDTAETILGRSNVALLKPIWSVPMGLSSPVVANGIVYASGLDGVHAFDATNGSSLWTFVPSVTVARISMPVVAHGIAYVAVNIPNSPHQACKGVVYAIDAVTGIMRWQARSGCSNSQSITVAQGLVIAGSGFTLNAISPSNGQLLWSFPTGGSIESTPAVAGGLVYVSSDDGNLYALNASTGLQVWSYPVGGGLSSPAVARGVLYVCLSGGTLVALNAAAGTLLWSFSPGSNSVSSPAVAPGLVYFGAYNGNVYAIRTSDGTMRWMFPTGFSNVGVFDPALANGVVYVGSDGGTFYALNSSTGKKLWSFVTPSVATPAVANGNVYVTSADPFTTNVLYDFGLSG
jgi:outer membrane protein assembly factor BamB